MIDIEREIREALRRHELEVPSFDGSEQLLVERRTRTRQGANAIGAILVASLVTLGVTTGVSALLRADTGKPADPPAPVVLAPPAEAPVTLGSGEADGWAWMLSASADGACVALTDAQGSEVACDDGRGDPLGEGVQNDIVTVWAWSPQEPAPPLAFIFGRVPPRAETVDLWWGRVWPTSTQLFREPGGVDLHAGFYVGWISGYGYPVVPDVTAWASGPDGSAVGDPEGDFPEGVPLERPSWAEPPTLTVLTSLASGTKSIRVGNQQGFVDWEIAIFRDEASGEVCLGEIGEGAVCGPAQDPAPAWEEEMLADCEEWFGGCTWPPFARVVNSGWVGKEGIGAFGWGVADASVDAVRSERTIFPGGWNGPTERDGWLDAEVINLPAEYGSLFRVWVYSCDDCLTGPTVFLDADGEEIGRDA
jgi:hypothetical protein